ncbi:hypothetical protein FPQ18DRAFT_300744 [Pyronema domesticum]|nr:hypothetical protein FPQ18DRAFT_300744 [Pyronema domesticum]
MGSFAILSISTCSDFTLSLALPSLQNEGKIQTQGLAEISRRRPSHYYLCVFRKVNGSKHLRITRHQHSDLVQHSSFLRFLESVTTKSRIATTTIRNYVWQTVSGDAWRKPTSDIRSNPPGLDERWAGAPRHFFFIFGVRNKNSELYNQQQQILPICDGS